MTVTRGHTRLHLIDDSRGNPYGGPQAPYPGQRYSDDGREETPLERLVAFLLVVPFDARFAQIGSFERTVYFVTLIFAALAAACTIAPSAQHRFLFRDDDKRHLVFVSNRVTIAGLGFLALAMCGSLMLVSSELFGVSAGVLTGSLAALAFGVLWFALPLWRRAKLGR